MAGNMEKETSSLHSVYGPEGATRRIFTTKVADYTVSRPDYPAALFKTLRDLCPPGPGVTVADVGAGTGLFTRGLLAGGYRVLAIEPNPDMRQECDRLLGSIPGYSSLEGAAEALPIAAGSVHLVTAAQAFHWFDLDRAREEFLRVLVCGGPVALIWNDRQHEDPLHVALDSVFNYYGGARRSALLAREDRSAVSRFFGAAQPLQFSWPHSHRLDEKAFLSLVFSRSYMPARDTAEGQEAVHKLREIFQRFAVGFTVEVRYRTVAMIGRPACHQE